MSTLTQDHEQLSHFTSVEKLLKILSDGHIKFSTIENTNDPRESLAPSVEYRFRKQKGNLSFFNLFDSWIQMERTKFKLLCFSSDAVQPPFSKPRMWSQYGGNHTGCCLVFDKSSIDGHLKSLGVTVVQGKVTYAASDKPRKSLDHKENEPIDKYFTRNIRYFCFTKNSDWKNEKEFRYLAKSDEEIGIPLESCLSHIYLSYKVDDLLFEKVLEVATPYSTVRKVRWKNGFAEVSSEFDSYEAYLVLQVGEVLRRILEIDVLDDSSHWNKRLEELISRYRSIPFPSPVTKEFIDPILEEYMRLKVSPSVTELLDAKRRWPKAAQMHQDKMIGLYENLGYEDSDEF